MKYKLEEVCKRIYSGGTPSTSHKEFWDGELMWLSSGETRQRFIYSTEKRITEEGANKSSTKLAEKNSIVMASAGQGQTRGQVSYLMEDMYVNQSVIVFDTDRKVLEPLYLYYNLDGRYNELRQLSDGTSTRGSLSGRIVKGMEIDVPSLDTQKKVIDILYKIDQKIEINEAINRNLYDTIAAMYKHDYIDVISKQPDWKEVTLDDITSKFATGLNPRKNFVLGHGNNYYVTIKNMNNNRIYLDSKCDMVDDEALAKINKRSDLQVGDLLFSGIGTIGRVHLIDKPANNWNISESVFTMRPTPNVSSEFMYLLLLSYDMQDYAVSLASGSVQKGIRMADLKRYKLMLPSLDDMERLTSAWKPIIAQMKKNEEESDKLALLRDTLLPKLMNGEINVSELEI